MSDAAGKAPPTSPNKTTGGDKCNCPAAALKICHAKKLKVKITPKKHEAPSAPKGTKLKFMPTPEPSDDKPQELTADLQVNRIKLPIKRLLKIEQRGKDTSAECHWWQYKEKSKRQQAYIDAGKQASAQLAFVRSTLGRWYDHEVLALLQDYDLVIETLASFHMDPNALYQQNTPQSPNAVDIEVEGEAEGTCATSSHLVLTCKSMSNTGFQYIDADPWPVGYPAKMKPPPGTIAPVSKSGYDLAQAAWLVGQKKFKLKEVHGAPLIADAQTPQNALAALLKFLKMGFSILHPMDIAIRMYTCGKKNQVMVEPAELNALVRVYRDVQFAIGIRIPAFRKVEHTQIGNVVEVEKLKVKDTDESKKTQCLPWDDGFGHQKVTKSEEGHRPTTKEEERNLFQIILRINDFELNLMEIYDSITKFGDVSYDKLFKGSQAQTPVMQMLKKHQWIFALAKMAGGTRKAWEGFYTAIDTFLSAMKQAPQLGWKITSEVSFLEGNLEAGLSLSQGAPNTKLPAEISKRYVPTKWKFKLGIGIVIVAGKIEVSFGLLLQIPGMGKLEARVVGQVTGSIELKGFEWEHVRGDDESEKKSSLSGKVCGRLFAVAGIETWFLTIKEEIGIEAGLQIDFTIKWTAEGHETELKIYTLPVQWYWVKVNTRTKVAASKAYVLYEPVLLLSDRSAEKNHKEGGGH